MDYSRFKLNGDAFLLPSETHLHIKDLNGTESENWTVYSACHEFLGESTVTFGGAPERAPEKAEAHPTEVALPAGLRFSMALAEDIPVATAAAGDAVKAKLTIDLRSDSKKVLVPKGTPVLCRIVRIRRFYNGKDPGVLGMLVPLQVVELILRLESFQLPEARRPVFAVVDVGVGGGSRQRAGGLQSRPVELGSLNAIWGNQWFARFSHAGDNYVIHSGLASNWVTVAP